MTGVIRTQLRSLAATIAGLKARVRDAVAGEVARAVADAAREVVEAVVLGRLDPLRPPAPAAGYRPPIDPRAENPDDGWGDDPADGWGRAAGPWGGDPDRDDGCDWGTPDERRTVHTRPDPPAAPPAVTAAVAAGVHVARWWVIRRGSRLAAAGVGLGVGLLGVFGGPAARAAVAVLAAAADLMAVTDALDGRAARLDPI